jgi:hypothetical protein
MKIKIIKLTREKKKGEVAPHEGPRGEKTLYTGEISS